MSSIKRPVMRYFGGKFRVREWVLNHFPPHRVYTEVFGGAASVLLSKPKSHIEVYNDLDGQLVNLFRVIRDNGEELQRLIEYTPYAREEYNKSGEDSTCDIERARRTLVKSWLSIGTDAIHRGKSGFRMYTNEAAMGTIPLHQWTSYHEQITLFNERLQGVLIENDNAADILKRHDYPDALHYVDPPYVHNTRSSGGYSFEMTDEQHEELADVLNSLDGMVVLSGYACDMYDRLYKGWRRVDKEVLADSRSKRVESLWLNPRTYENQSQQDLFSKAA